MMEADIERNPRSLMAAPAEDMAKSPVVLDAGEQTDNQEIEGMMIKFEPTESPHDRDRKLASWGARVRKVSSAGVLDLCSPSPAKRAKRGQRA